MWWFGRGFGWGRGWGWRGNPFPFCRWFPWLPRGWRWMGWYPGYYPWYSGYPGYTPFYPFSSPQSGEEKKSK